MCGYIGKISLNKIDTKSLNEANQIQVCRGPDETKNLNLDYKDRFNISLIFNRLAIIDLDIKASQPMYSKEHNSYLLFNGEIFNFTELRRELEQKGEKFRTSHSDTEVLLLGISRYGAKFLDKCNGQFSFFYINLNTGKVILCRDRLGQKPLFYKYENNELVFSTNLISLVKSLKLNKSDISYDSLNKYINLGVVTSPDTIFQNINKVRPGSYLEFNLFKNIEFVQEIKYWNMESFIDENQFSNQVFENLFYDACSVRTRSDVPFSSFLSGGIDSTSVTKNLYEVLDSVDTFSIVQKNPKYNEEKWIDFVAHKYNANQEKVNISNNIFQNEITHSIGAFDEPAVHVTYAEAERYCEWKRKRLPTKREWVEAGDTEKRVKPTDGYITGRTYPYPTGESPAGANCLSDCDAETLLVDKKKNYHVKLNRGLGHAPVGVSKQGVNGLYDMGANVWEWAKLPSDNGHQATMGGSWWYGKRQMQANYGATKPEGMAVVYIGFRCVSD